MIWIPGRDKLSDPGTNTYSLLTQAFLQTTSTGTGISTGRIAINLSGFEGGLPDLPLESCFEGR